MEEKKVKCADCGFLAMRRSEVGNKVLEDVSEVERGEGGLPESTYERAPVCAALAYDLKQEHIETNKKTEDKWKRYALVVRCERVCDKFMQWIPTFTPKDHVQMMHLENQRKAIESQRKADEDFREEIRKADRERDERNEITKQARDETIRKEDLVRAKRESRDRWIQWGFVILLGLLGAFFGNALFKKPEKPEPPIINVFTGQQPEPAK